MSPLTITRIANVLTQQFRDHIDMSDLAKHPPEQVETAFLSRAMAALAVRKLAGEDPVVAAKSVVDGYNDGGIDAIHFDAKTDTLLFVQAKWSKSGNASINEIASNKFANGVRDLLADRFERFDQKVRDKESEIRSVLYSERAIRLRLVTIHTGSQPPPPHATKSIEDLVTELNGAVQIASYEDFDQAGAYGLITSETADPKIKLQIALHDWGQIEQPYLAYYGRANVTEVAQWWKEHRSFLFTQNLRLFYTNSGVNNAIQRTLSESPENFWYFNNGITVICDAVDKSLVGSPGRALGLFNCDGVSIVNGAQTVGSIGTIVGSSVDPAEEFARSFVPVRIISLAKTSPEFGRQITRAANLQNAVGNREFAAMDPLQHRLATDFALDKRRYVYKTGESDPRSDDGCSIVEATQALASERSIALAVQVKREIGAIWADTAAPPYTDLFNEDLTTSRLWRAVRVMRAVDEELHFLKASMAPRASLVAIHLNRVILHFVFQDAEVRRSFAPDRTDDDVTLAARQATPPIFQKVSAYLEGNHGSDYLAQFAKNTAKCEELARTYDRRDGGPPGAQGSLLDWVRDGK
ncbi:AIPR family protein [Phenylobacterium sp.]|uniref:AIPR family protein n=1 Tax=Phenylobacterium sp. TaxID=1871053 RepID=UPI002723CBC9|nr:AIPR family protein [Phenylobacterium sp.]MDO8379583.1 AIPR family protein [Phenylobacterium sp.]